MADVDFLGTLDRALAVAIPGFERVTTIARLSGGASQETFAFDALVNGTSEPLILRRTPGGAPRVISSEGSNAVQLETEAIVIEASRAQGVAAPRVRYVLKPEDGVGSGYVMDRLPGETIARKILRDPEFDAVRPNLATQCGQILAHIHKVDIAPLKNVLPVIDGPIQFERYRKIYESYDYPHPVFDFAMKWLEPRLKKPRQYTLVHGDFRHGNLLISPRGVEAALDWELTHIGDPLEDIGWICTNCWRFGIPEKVVGGFGDLENLLAAYQAAGGAHVEIDDARTWIVYGSLKWGIMCMGMYQSFKIDGSVERAAIGRRSSENEIDLVNLIIHGKI